MVEKILAGAAQGVFAAVLIVAVTVLVVFVACLVPLVMFWAVEVLTGSEIPLTFETWLAAWALLLIFKADLSGGKS